MPERSDSRVLFAAERTLLAWQRRHHLLTLIVGVLFILLGSGVAIAASIAYRQAALIPAG